MSKQHIFILLFSALSITLSAQSTAAFDFFEYKGNDAIFMAKINEANQFRNPVLAGFYPDPSICRKGDTFYLVNSSFAFFPGIPIFTSKDLVRWTQIGHVLDRPSQLEVDGLRIYDGIYAPAITYNKFNDTFYLITTSVYGIGNFIVKTKDPLKGWSEPILLPEVTGIDPSLFFDDDGKAYIVNNDAPQGTPEYEGHRAIWIHQFDTENDCTFGTPKMLVDGGIDKSKKPIWIEGPHIYRRNGKYLLICAEGGTSVNHSQVALFADNVFGPYIPAKINPILTQRDLPENRKNKITSVGHADIVEDIDGKSWAVFLGCRPYEGNMYNTGRETFILPVKWKNDVPFFCQRKKNGPLVFKKKNHDNAPLNTTGNFTFRDDFSGNELGYNWLMIQSPKHVWYKKTNKQLILEPTTANIYEKKQPAFIGYRQQHTNFQAVTSLKFTPTTETELAGVVCFQNEEYNFVFGKTIVNGKMSIVLDRSEKETKRITALKFRQNTTMQLFSLKLQAKADTIVFLCRTTMKTGFRLHRRWMDRI
jgi:alpha-N-arabinofuranosidase